jgi:hypothetical protein
MESAPVCRNCGKPMAFATRISMPRQIVYRCEPCKEQSWIPERRVESQKGAVPTQQQQQPQKKDSE